MGIQERKKREQEEIRERIVNAAEKLFLEKGYAHVSMRNIAQEIEYSTTVIYKLFPNKQAILLRLFADKYGILLERFNQIREAGGSGPRQKLEELVKAYLAFGREYPDYYQLAVIRNVVSEDRDLPYMDEDSVILRLYQIFVETVKDCLASGQPDNRGPEAVAQSVWACLHGALSLRIVHTQFPWVSEEQFYDTIAEIAIKGAF